MIADYTDEEISQLNAFHMALIYNRNDIIKYFSEKLRVNIKESIKDP